jgi:hypothetical protein
MPDLTATAVEILSLALTALKRKILLTFRFFPGVKLPALPPYLCWV